MSKFIGNQIEIVTIGVPHTRRAYNDHYDVIQLTYEKYEKNDTKKFSDVLVFHNFRFK